MFANQQHGFVKGKSTVNNLLTYVQHLIKGLESQQVNAIYTDFSKAFDRVTHKGLLAKLEALGVGVEFNLERFREISFIC